MGFNYGREKRKFDKEWERLEAEYTAAGMPRNEYSGLRVPPIRNGIPTKRRMIPTSFLHAIRRNVLSVRK